MTAKTLWSEEPSAAADDDDDDAYGEELLLRGYWVDALDRSRRVQQRRGRAREAGSADDSESQRVRVRARCVELQALCELSRREEAKRLAAELLGVKRAATAESGGGHDAAAQRSAASSVIAWGSAPGALAWRDFDLAVACLSVLAYCGAADTACDVLDSWWTRYKEQQHREAEAAEEAGDGRGGDLSDEAPTAKLPEWSDAQVHRLVRRVWIDGLLLGRYTPSGESDARCHQQQRQQQQQHDHEEEEEEATRASRRARLERLLMEDGGGCESDHCARAGAEQSALVRILGADTIRALWRQQQQQQQQSHRDILTRQDGASVEVATRGNDAGTETRQRERRDEHRTLRDDDDDDSRCEDASAATVADEYRRRLAPRARGGSRRRRNNYSDSHDDNNHSRVRATCARLLDALHQRARQCRHDPEYAANVITVSTAGVIVLALAMMQWRQYWRRRRQQRRRRGGGEGGGARRFAEMRAWASRLGDPRTAADAAAAAQQQWHAARSTPGGGGAWWRGLQLGRHRVVRSFVELARAAFGMSHARNDVWL